VCSFPMEKRSEKRCFRVPVEVVDVWMDHLRRLVFLEVVMEMLQRLDDV
jgi:hypothetical protein